MDPCLEKGVKRFDSAVFFLAAPNRVSCLRDKGGSGVANIFWLFKKSNEGDRGWIDGDFHPRVEGIPDTLLKTIEQSLKNGD